MGQHMHIDEMKSLLTGIEQEGDQPMSYKYLPTTNDLCKWNGLVLLPILNSFDVIHIDDEVVMNTLEKDF